MNFTEKYKNRKAGIVAPSLDRSPLETPTEGGNPSPRTTVTAVPAKPPLPAYKIIYSRILDDFLLLVDTDKDKAALEASGIKDVIYTHAEVQEIEGLPEDSIRAHHKIKKAFPSRIENIKKAVTSWHEKKQY